MVGKRVGLGEYYAVQQEKKEKKKSLRSASPREYSSVRRGLAQWVKEKLAKSLVCTFVRMRESTNIFPALLRL